LWVLSFSILAGAPTTGAVPQDFEDTRIATVASPTALAFTPDGRLLITTQDGRLRIYESGALRPAAALDLTDVICSDNERGLLGVAVDPNFSVNRHIYLFYTSDQGGSCVNRVSRFVLAASNTVDRATELVLVNGMPSTAGNHNAGDVKFGKDGYLYISIGDGGCDYAATNQCAGANDAARDQHVLTGKILRIAPDGGIPPTNPFLGTDSARCNVTGRTDPGKKCQETFAWGLRNPFRMAFDPNAAGTRFFINDVGQGAWEEINLGQAGADYGWNVREGLCVNGSTTNCGAPPAGMTNPIFAYGRSDGCVAITGGAFVPNGVWPSAYDGAYLFSDYVCGRIFTLTPNGTGGYTRTAFATGLGNSSAVAMTFGPHGTTQALYYTSYAGGGEIRRIAYADTSNTPPSAVSVATPTHGALPLDVGFSASGSSDVDGDPLTYEWNFGDGSPIATTVAPHHTYTTKGVYTVVLTVRDNHGGTATATAIIHAGHTPPTPAIASPTSSHRFRVGEAIVLHGSASDVEDGTIPASGLRWAVLLHHDTHTHPFFPSTVGNNLTFQAPPPEDFAAAANSYLEIQLTATDSSGLSRTITQDLLPRTVNVTFATNPSGLRLVANGANLTGPQTAVSWDGYVLSVSAQAQTDGSGQAWAFSSWSDGGAAQHSIVTPATATTYSATFSTTSPPPTSGLVAAYAFGEGSGSSVADATGNGLNGAISGATWTTGGKYGSALSFDGVNDWVTVNDANALDLTTAMTVEAWVYPTASGSGSWRNVLIKERAGGEVYNLYANANTNAPVTFVVRAADPSATPDARGTTPLPLNTWTHLAVTYDGTTLRLFVNGTQVGTRAVSGALLTSTGALRLGGNSVWGEFFQGRLDEVRIYNRALTTTEIQADMNTAIQP
jgi:glucose/arabinose dehydrogenase